MGRQRRTEATDDDCVVLLQRPPARTDPDAQAMRAALEELRAKRTRAVNDWNSWR
jgi:hypothetical protein